MKGIADALYDMKYRIRSSRLSERDYSQPGSYFITICTKERKSHFGKVIDGEVQLNDIGNIVQNVWFEIPSHFENVELDTHVIMPNHVHLIITINGDDYHNERDIIKTERNHRRDNS